MVDTNLLVLAREYKKLREEVKKVLSMPKGDKGDPGEKGEKGDTGATGPQGFPGRDGKDGVNGFNGKDGRDGIDGKDGRDGLDGVGVQNAYIDFDNSLVIVLSDGREVNAGFLSQETKENVVATFKQGASTINELLSPQEGNANKFLKTDGTNVSWDTLDGSDIDLASPPVIGSTTPAAATFTTLTTTGAVNFTSSASNADVFFTNTTSSGYFAFSATDGSRFASLGLSKSALSSYGNANEAFIRGSGQSTGLAISSASATTPNIRFITGASGSSFEQVRFAHTANAVNYLQLTGSATGNRVRLSAAGSDSSIGVNFDSKGSGSFAFTTNANSNPNLLIFPQDSPANWLQLRGVSAGQAVPFTAQGTDTNVALAFLSKGTGAINLAPGSSGVNISNGGTVTAVTRTSSGGLYTSIPTIAISAPTTAGGVQATAAVAFMQPQAATIANGGSGYTVGDVLTLSGGTPTGGASTFTVTAVSGGVITAATSTNFATYSVLPTNPVSVTGGTGTGATLNVTWGLSANPGSFTITNAGSGYVEQPTVTFSGGGGSGAAAYATVGSFATIKALGSGQLITSAASVTSTSVGFLGTNPAIPNFVIRDGAAAADSFLIVGPGQSVTGLTAIGNANAVLTLGANGSGSVRPTTNGTSATEQARITHTANAVNTVQITGAATGGTPTLSAQGSDTNVNLSLSAKGSGIVFIGGSANATTSTVRLNPSGGNALHASANSSSVNYVTVSGRGTGNSPDILARGTDANVGLNFGTLNDGNIDFYASGDLNAGTGRRQVRIAPTANAVNFVQVTGAATGSGPTISAQGSDTNVGIILGSKGVASVQFRTNNNTNLQALVSHTANSVNWATITGSATNTPVVFGAAGNDNDIDLALTPKGTGNVRFGTYTASMALTVQGYIEIKDSGGTVRRLAVVA